MRTPLMLSVLLIAALPLRAADDRIVQPERSAENSAPAAEGCYLKVRAKNSGSRSIQIDIDRSRIATYSGVWRSITKTSDITIPADDDYKNFTIWARLCGRNIGHVVRLYLTRGSEATTANIQGRGTDLGSMGDLARHF